MNSAALIEEQAADWIARRDSGSWSVQQQAEMDAWINAATAHRIAYLRLNSAWQRADRLSSLHVPSRNSVPGKSFALPRFSGWRVAAGLALAASAALFAALPGGQDKAASFATAVGESKAVSLADGSHITLNTDTRLRASIANGKRTVGLESGEAYFEVAHDASRPFVVEAGDSRVTVLGTKFSVRREAGQVKVVVVDGRVQVSEALADNAGKEAPVNGGNGSNGSNGSGAAPPGSVAIVTRNDTLVAEHGNMAVMRKTPEQVSNQLGWRQGKLILDDMTLDQAAIEFNRYNRKKLVIADPVAGQVRIGGSFNVDNVDGFARLLHQGFGLRVEAGKDEIKILR
ncbi:FecR family protein [Undibacterium sp.]|uniref:FecR family protein n=1 Tax=Undibacterium sp. TaxID=1914977 RepID=UPI00374CB734